MDPEVLQERALAAMQAALDGTLARPGDLPRRWPRPPAGDLLAWRAWQETLHLLLEPSLRQREIVRRLRVLLRRGATAAEIEAAYPEGGADA